MRYDSNPSQVEPVGVPTCAHRRLRGDAPAGVPAHGEEKQILTGRNKAQQRAREFADKLPGARAVIEIHSVIQSATVMQVGEESAHDEVGPGARGD